MVLLKSLSFQHDIEDTILMSGSTMFPYVGTPVFYLHRRKKRRWLLYTEVEVLSTQLIKMALIILLSFSSKELINTCLYVRLSLEMVG